MTDSEKEKVYNDLIQTIAVYREIKLLTNFSHENIIKLRQFYTPDLDVRHFKNVYMIFEPIDTTLKEIIGNKLTRVSLGYHEISTLVRQICLGVKFLQDNGVIHRDLKPANIGISHTPYTTIKIMDFGCSKMKLALKDETASMTTKVGSLEYKAPELLLRLNDKSKVDNWSIGCIFGELLTGRQLFPCDSRYSKGGHDLQQFASIITKLGFSYSIYELLQSNYRRPLLEHEIQELIKLRHIQGIGIEALIFDYTNASMSQSGHNENQKQSARDLLQKLLDIDFRSRIEMEDVLSHDYFGYFDDVEGTSNGAYDSRLESLTEYPMASTSQWREHLFKEVKAVRLLTDYSEDIDFELIEPTISELFADSGPDIQGILSMTRELENMVFYSSP